MKGFLVLSIAIILLFGAPAFADIKKGMDAFVNNDYVTAVSELTPHAKQGNADVQFLLGFIYRNGNEDFAKNYKAALNWYRLAADQGDGKGQSELGGMYAQGQGVPQNNKTAIKWFRLAAEQGDDQGQMLLGTSYYMGSGVIQDYKTAVKWFRLAAEQGNAFAQTKLGVMYSKGWGVNQDNATAHMWLNIAISLGAGKSANNLRDGIQIKMNPSQLEKAHDLARECVAKDYKGC